MDSSTKTAPIRLNRVSPACWRVTFDNPPLNLMVRIRSTIQDIMNALESDAAVKVGFSKAQSKLFLNHSDFLAKLRI